MPSMTRRQWLERLAMAGAGLSLGGRAFAAASRPRAAPVIDGLCVFADLEAGPKLDADWLAAVRGCGMTAINNTTPAPGDDAAATLRKIAQVKSIIDRHPDALRLVLDAGDLGRCQADGRLGVIIGFQSTEMFADGLEAVDRFHGHGVRIMQMTYNGPGAFGNGCLSPASAGLTALGREALARMQARGVLVDVSHANKATTADTIAASTRPPVISHTGCNAVHRHPRNNDDEELRALAERGGVAGIYLMPFLDGGSGELTAEMLFAHLGHALRVCGEEHVGIGSDQGLVPVDDGPEYRETLRKEVEARRAAGISAPGESADRPPFIPEFNRSDRLAAIAERLSGRYPERVVDGVVGGNFARVMRAAWG